MPRTIKNPIPLVLVSASAIMFGAGAFRVASAYAISDADGKLATGAELSTKSFALSAQAAHETSALMPVALTEDRVRDTGCPVGSAEEITDTATPAGLAGQTKDMASPAHSRSRY